ncbi:F0F1 ATP synthase subunit epsilon [Gallaecimonas kandeliae]|uniref:F0F1 ATP synthase subunit epsilon n=1 Tax=Gallaecimonas kandeliae TaxID=3029055 RepID=UPI00264885BB|nr:F0F1 ATP synthase subunit epsilon [Gallaecimonas kandeliae]WKE64221.1 F0F1 ATP synthase subunit epsilon [Gallaecimonas kandeliae]
MKGFELRLLDTGGTRTITGVSRFVGEDGSGSFGILPGHGRFMASLVMGLARFRVQEGGWQYLALPGALLYFQGGRLTLVSRHYLLDDDYNRISEALARQLLAEEEKLHGIKESLERMEEALMKRLWEMGRR